MNHVFRFVIHGSWRWRFSNIEIYSGARCLLDLDIENANTFRLCNCREREVPSISRSKDCLFLAKLFELERNKVNEFVVAESLHLKWWETAVMEQVKTWAKPKKLKLKAYNPENPSERFVAINQPFHLTLLCNLHNQELIIEKFHPNHRRLEPEKSFNLRRR